MVSLEANDIADLLAPISEDAPCGVDLRWDDLYDQIRLARRSTEASIEGEIGQEADWKKVIELASKALGSRTKDLMIAGWLTEALVHRDGFEGLRQGLQLLLDLVERYWPHLHPLPEGDDLEPRVAPLVWLTEMDRGARLPNVLREVPLVPSDEGGEVFSWKYWKSKYATPGSGEDEDAARRRAAAAAEREQRFEQAAAVTPRDYFAGLTHTMHESMRLLKELDTRLTASLGELAPSFTAMRQTLEECEVVVRRILKDKGSADPESEGDGSDGATAAGEGSAGHAKTEGATNGAVLGAGPIRSRDEALRRLAEAAAYLRRTEPQSPVPFLIDRAVAWGRMPFDRLLLELVKDAGTRTSLSELLGIKLSEPE